MKIYCLIDCQNDFIDGVLGTPEAQLAVPRICEELAKVTDEDLVLVTQDSHTTEDYFDTQEGKNLPVLHCVDHTHGWCINADILKMIDNTAHHYFYIKTMFGSQKLANMIRLCKGDGVDEIIFMGFCTDICVITNALLAKTAAPDLPIKVIADCCAGVTPEKHEAALEVMRSCQIEVI